MIPLQNKNSFYNSLSGTGITIVELFGYGAEKIFIAEYIAKTDIKCRIMSAVDITALLEQTSPIKAEDLQDWIRKTESVLMDINVENCMIIERKFK